MTTEPAATSTGGWSHNGDPWTPFRRGLALVLAVVLVGTAGYTVLGLGVLDALYQTLITVSTVGFREVGPETETNAYKIFTMLLVVTGAGTVLYAAGTLFEALVEGRLTNDLRRRRMQRSIADLEGHIVVCGWGQVGRAITNSITTLGHDVVVVDRRPEVADDAPLSVIGDATGDDDVLIEAGLARASALVVALDTDAANVYVTLTGRSVQPDLFIVARAMTASAEAKLTRAGANRVVNPHELGGAHMAALVVQPNVADYLEVVMHNRDLEVRLAELEVSGASVLVDTTVEGGRLRQDAGVTVLAIRRADGFVHHPDAQAEMHAGDVVIVLGTPEQLEAARTLAGRPA